MRRTNLTLAGLWVAFAVAAALLAGRGDLVNEDYEKIVLNGGYLTEGPIWKKAVESEAGFERGYYRPVNNLVLASLFRVYEGDSNRPFRVAAALAFALAAGTIFAAARTLTGSLAAAFAAFFLFAFHPVHSWSYFQASWTGNSFVVFFFGAAAWIWHRAVAAAGAPRWALPALAAAVFLAGLSRDSGALFALFALPAVFLETGDSRHRASRAFAAAAAGAAAYVALRTLVIGNHGAWDASRWIPAVSNYGSTVLQYAATVAAGEVRNYARPLASWGGPLVTAGAALAGAALLWALRKDRVSLFLAWGLALSTIEMAAAAGVSPEISPTRASAFLAFLILLIARLWKLRAAAVPSAFRTGVLAVLFLYAAFSASASAAHVRASFDENAFYKLHNEPPYNWKTVFIEARREYEKGESARAAKLYETSLGFSDRPVTRNNYALSLWRLGRRSEAVEQHRAALRGAPHDASYHLNLGLALESTAVYSGAVLHFSTAAELDPKDPRAFDGLARVLRATGRDAEAVNAYALAVDVLPDNAPLRNNYGLLLARLNRDEAAIEQFEKAIELKPSNAIALNNLGMAMVKKRDFEAAGRYFRLAVAADPRYAKARNNLGIFLAGAGRYREAIREFETVLRLDPDLPTAKENLAEARKRAAASPDLPASVEPAPRPASAPAAARPAPAPAEATPAPDPFGLSDLPDIEAEPASDGPESGGLR